MTQKQKILTIMLRAERDKFFYPYEFMRPELGDLFVGYKAPTRITEMAKFNPELFVEKKEDKYKQRRLNWAALPRIAIELPKELQEVLKVEGYHSKAQTIKPVRKSAQAPTSVQEVLFNMPQQERRIEL